MLTIEKKSRFVPCIIDNWLYPHQIRALKRLIIPVYIFYYNVLRLFPVIASLPANSGNMTHEQRLYGQVLELALRIL